ncbi:hypothetical protein M2447_002000 [Ereboglobus sp. PH5-10]|uniref:S8 family peptidase n=1 Tax=Ereboglobus sp. PH5-10 TaxID=2940629 RepID=UPI002405C548|nr:S8 family serine peptidase [Ereboglobus sp. PH5-10]MDF9827895.1 hypothetical protein [Ereboglobus sp. PH5-10]
MHEKPRSPIVPALITLALIGFMAWTLVKHQRRAEGMAAAEKARTEATDDRAALTAAAQKARANALTAEARRLGAAAFKEQLAAHLDNDHVRRNEAVLAFKDAGALQRFLARAKDAGLMVLSSSEKLLSARVRYASLDGLASEITDNSSDYEEVGGNFIAEIPTVPETEARTARSQVPVRDNLLGAIGVAGADNSQWGRGVTIAVLDSGVAADATFGQRVRRLDAGHGVSIEAGEGHGTAVASLAAGADADAPGVAPAADILSLRVTDSNGLGDLYTISEAIMLAADSGAQIINVSLGSYGTSAVLLRAIEYAMQGGAVVVAAAGNDQAAQLMWPAAYSRVISVGATDAMQQQLIFSNSGAQLQITAPGYAILAAWADESRVGFTGTSASAPVVSGAIAALMSAYGGISAQEAWAILVAHVNDAGAEGRDDDYGAGVIDLGWALESNDPTRMDTAISSHYYNSKDGTVDVVVQNRGATAMSGMTLVVEVNGAVSNVALPWVDARATTVVKVPVPEGAETVVNTTLLNAGGVTDKNPSNNHKASVVSLGGGE